MHHRIPPATTSTVPLGARGKTQPTKKGGGGGEDLVTTCLPGQSNADSTTAKLATHIPTTKVINAPLCQNQNNLMLDYFDGFLFLLPGRIEKLSLRGLRLERIDRRGRMGGRGGDVVAKDETFGLDDVFLDG